MNRKIVISTLAVSALMLAAWISLTTHASDLVVAKPPIDEPDLMGQLDAITRSTITQRPVVATKFGHNHPDERQVDDSTGLATNFDGSHKVASRPGSISWYLDKLSSYSENQLDSFASAYKSRYFSEADNFSADAFARDLANMTDEQRAQSILGAQRSGDWKVISRILLSSEMSLTERNVDFIRWALMSNTAEGPFLVAAFSTTDTKGQVEMISRFRRDLGHCLGSTVNVDHFRMSAEKSFGQPWYDRMAYGTDCSLNSQHSPS